MSTTGQLQAIGGRGYSLRWSTLPHDRQDYDILVLDLLDRAGSVVASDRRPIKVRGSVITRAGEEAQRAAQIAWAEELTRHPLLPPVVNPPEREAIEESIQPKEERPNGEEVSPPVPGVGDVEAEAHDPV